MKAIQSITKAEQVRQAILEMIFAGELVAGQRIVEARLASVLDVSQATVNAALRRRSGWLRRRRRRVLDNWRNLCVPHEGKRQGQQSRRNNQNRDDCDVGQHEPSFRHGNLL